MKRTTESLYEELRKATDGGSESMTHDDAVKQIEYWQGAYQREATLESDLRTHLAEIERLRTELREGDDLRERLAGILTRSVNMIRGEPEPMSLHSWHDLPELVEALKADSERLDWLCSEESDALTAPTDNQRYLTAEAWERLADCTGVYSKSQKIAAIDAARSK